jgi:hypothetical protein
MRHTVTCKLELFIASPSDLNEEREAVDRVLDDLNSTFLRGKDVEIVPRKWENDTYTKYAGNDAQFLVNGQIGDSYDAVLVMFWSRIGSATPRALSGTVEELERAIYRFERTGRPHIMPYFKTAGLNPYDVDLDQIKGVQSLHTLMQRGGLVRKFETIKEFERALQKDLILWMENDINRRRKSHALRPTGKSLSVKKR